MQSVAEFSSTRERKEERKKGRKEERRGKRRRSRVSVINEM